MPARETASDAAARRHMIRLAVVPAGIVAVTAVAVLVYVVRAQSQTGTAQPAADGADGAMLWGILAGSLLLTCAVIVGAALFASSEAKTTVERYAALRRTSERGQSELRAVLQRLEQGEAPRMPGQAPPPEPTGDALDGLAHELALAQRTAQTAMAEAVALVKADSSGSDEKVEVFVNLARRLQSLVHREIELLDELENEVEDPDLLKGLFHVDHLATRIRRHAENLAVLGGAVSRRQWTRPVTMTEVLRSAIAEVEQYSRVKLVPPVEGTLRGHAVADVIHLLSELVENATIFSAPQTQVLLRAQHVTAGLAIEVEDRGLGMTTDEQNRMNALLSEPEQFDVGELLSDGRIGIFVVSALARRHGIVVQLQSNIYGGIQAVLVLPRGLLGEMGEDSLMAAAAQPAAAVAAAQPQPHAQEPVHGHPQEHRGAESTPVAQADGTRPGPGGRAEAGPVRSASGPAPTPPTPSAGASPEQRMAASPPAAPSNERPQLPKRRRQEHLAPELRDAPTPHDGTAPEPQGGVTAEPDAGHDPGLMAAFQRGAYLADENDGPDPSTHAPGGDTPNPAN